MFLVFILSEPTVQWAISEIDKHIYKRRVTLESEGQESIRRHPTQLFISQKKAVDACIEEIQRTGQIILGDMRESLSRLDAPNRIKSLNKLKKSL